MSDPSHPLRALRPIVLRFLKPVHLCDRVAPGADAAHAGRPRIGRARPTGLQRPLLARVCLLWRGLRGRTLRRGRRLLLAEAHIVSPGGKEVQKYGFETL